ncbi:MAG: flagellar basal body P-ring formation protein FlgA [Pseudomonadota bacterium]|nr:flagellar basal body P-ring formation protein FlgA [Pseudomonadota bacterium]
MKILSAILTLIAASVAGTGVSLAEEGFQSPQSIQDAARQFLLANPETRHYSETSIEIGHLDSRLQLQQCDQPLQTSLAPGSRFAGKTTVAVRCASPKPWALYVSANVSTLASVYQTAVPLPRDHIITEQDLTAVKTDLGKLNRGYYSKLDDLLGKQTRRSLPPGQILHPAHIKVPNWVKRGEQVALVAGNPQFSIRTQGEALNDGAVGDQVRVKNLSSNRIVEGTVTAQGTVTVMN